MKLPYNIYSADQASILFPHWPEDAECFIIGGPANANEAQTIKNKHPHVSCIGFEPCPVGLELQKKQLDFPGEVYPFALWNKNTCLQLDILGNSGNRSRVSEIPVLGSHDNIVVEGRTLDSLSKDFGPWKNIALWMDIEGSEYRALEGADKLLNEVLILDIEVREASKNLPKFVELLEPYGLSLVCTWNTASVHGLVDAIFKKRTKDEVLNLC